MYQKCRRTGIVLLWFSVFNVEWAGSIAAICTGALAICIAQTLEKFNQLALKLFSLFKCNRYYHVHVHYLIASFCDLLLAFEGLILSASFQNEYL